MTPPKPNRRRLRIATALAAAALAGVGVAYAVTAPTADEAMADRASDVMPFDLDETSHSFTKNDAGGIETVVAHDPADTENIALIREHLRKEAELFAAGDFGDPAAIHGDDMSGLRELEAGAGRIDVLYTDLPAGAQISFGSADPALVDALHRWFDAQSGDHAKPGMGH